MKKIPVSVFKAECFSILDHLEPEGLDITNHGKVVARVIPAEHGGLIYLII